jgi:F-type H+-transporting ATPase subunit epsilon
MANTINLKIITPERIVFESPVDQVTAVSRDGELTILPGHEPLVTTLAIDVMRFKRQGEEETAAIIGGIMEVSTSEVTIMSDMAELDVEIDETRAKQAKEKAEAEKIQKDRQNRCLCIRNGALQSDGSTQSGRTGQAA